MLPPLDAVAVKITLFPEQMLLLLADILTDGVTYGVTVMRILLEVALFGEAHEEALVTMQYTVSLLVSAELI